MSAQPALFFYGTLRHRPLLDLVLGAAGAERVRLTPAALPGHEALWVEGECFPMIRRNAGTEAVGVMAEGLKPDDMARLSFYEGAYLFAMRKVEVRTGEGARTALVFFPETDAWRPGAPFDLDDWAARWGAITLGAAAEYMAGYGIWSAGDAALICCSLQP